MHCSSLSMHCSIQPGYALGSLLSAQINPPLPMWLLSWEFIWGPACLFSSHPRSEMIYKGRRQCWSNGCQGRRVAQIWLPLKSSLWQSEGQLGVEGVERGVLLTRWGKVRERLNLGIWRRDLQAVTLLLASGKCVGNTLIVPSWILEQSQMFDATFFW